ncbi:transposase [Synechococcus sp. PCC 6312]|uniref:transposase n=1 Tax=Synechococcus sp. (strain ATCC 27167 / PCC 6312) TaxID=195253 RepID=UPI00155A3822|nr:transposase [Synechococcus sp. PCC 6312]
MSHLVWGDTCGYTWGKIDTRVHIPISNPKQRQTYYGEINYRTGQIIMRAYTKGNSVNTIKFIETLRTIHPHQKLILIWDGATYHDSQEFRNYLSEVNGDKPEHHWPLYYIKLAPYVPEQNPIKAMWLQAKNFLRKVWHLFKTFKTVKWLFQSFINHFILRSAQLNMYGIFSSIITVCSSSQNQLGLLWIETHEL